MKPVYVLFDKFDNPIIGALCEEGAMYCMARHYYAVKFKKMLITYSEYFNINNGDVVSEERFNKL